MQLQCECFTVSNVSGEDPWRLRFKIECVPRYPLIEYMFFDVPKLDVHNFALFCCLL
jgi:hypothetical protein